ncbi:hypothetical protein AMATHDRAFT_66605 [Amanita thiersii Skay4041]|uniref:Uncharacterized protein n=1 Tax=Amanita thiersii Skay4041 TaxID=703135 RepID=A0A2A9NJI6_9AGAR|nr:hypothetical protein AMATHDRAFT_66605 [Amanita thiersii Skay4041]
MPRLGTVASNVGRIGVPPYPGLHLYCNNCTCSDSMVPFGYDDLDASTLSTMLNSGVNS